MTQKDDFDEMIQAMKQDKDGTRKFWSPPSDKEGTFPIRILPRIKDKGETKFYFKHRVHWVNKKSYECSAQTMVDKNGNLHEAEECPICKFVSRLYDTSVRDSDDWKLAGSLRAQDRYVYRIVVRGKDDEREPVFYETGKGIFEVLYHMIVETDYKDITNMKDGRDFILSKKGVGRNSKYDTSLPSVNAGPVFTNVDDLKILIERMKSMDYNSLVEFTDIQDLKKILQDFISGGNESDGGSTPSAKNQEAPKPAQKEREEQPKHNQTPSNEDDAINDILKEFEN